MSGVRHKCVHGEQAKEKRSHTNRPCNTAHEYAAIAAWFWNNQTLRKGCEAPYLSQHNVTMIPATPNTIGMTVRQLSHGYCVPPQVMPMRKLHVLEMNRDAPIQSVRKIRSRKLARWAFRRITNGTMAKPIAQKGKLM